MSLFTESDLRSRAATQERSLRKTADSVLNEWTIAADSATDFHIFLSHSLSDQQLILGAWLALQERGYRVYVDWIHDRRLSRDNVTRKTAAVLRQRMQMSKCLLFATTAHSSASKWMPWELGFMDGHSGRTAILPITRYEETHYEGQEYLGLYPYISSEVPEKGTEEVLWVNTSRTCYVRFDNWVRGSEPREH
jgi:hypothetical protein